MQGSTLLCLWLKLFFQWPVGRFWWACVSSTLGLRVLLPLLSQQEWHQVWFSTDVAHPLQRCVVQRCSSAFLSYNEWFFELSVNFPSARSSLAIWPLPSGTAHWIFFLLACGKIPVWNNQTSPSSTNVPCSENLKSPFFLILMDLITSTWLNSPSCDMCTY